MHGMAQEGDGGGIKQVSDKQLVEELRRRGIFAVPNRLVLVEAGDEASVKAVATSGGGAKTIVGAPWMRFLGVAKGDSVALRAVEDANGRHVVVRAA